jgi:predicted membrane channel-forming protein YqfA (hemolysin III family)
VLGLQIAGTTGDGQITAVVGGLAILVLCAGKVIAIPTPALIASITALVFGVLVIIIATNLWTNFSTYGLWITFAGGVGISVGGILGLIEQKSAGSVPGRQGRG